MSDFSSRVRHFGTRGIAAAIGLLAGGSVAQESNPTARVLPMLSVGAQHLVLANVVRTTAGVVPRIQPDDLKALDSAVNAIYGANPALAAMRTGVLDRAAIGVSTAQADLQKRVAAWTGAAVAPDLRGSVAVATAEFASMTVMTQLSTKKQVALSALYGDALGTLKQTEEGAKVVAGVIAAMKSDDIENQRQALETTLKRLPELEKLAGLDQLEQKFRGQAEAYMLEVLKGATGKTPKQLAPALKLAQSKSLKDATDALLQLGGNIDSRVGQVLQGVKALKEASDGFSAAVSSLQGDPLAVSNFSLLQRLDPKTQIEALERGLNVGGIAKADALLGKVELTFSATTTTSIVKTYDAINQGVKVAAAAANVARAIGLKVPPEVDKAIEIGNTAVSVTAGFATAGPIGGGLALFGAIGGGGLFGGKKAGPAGPDPVTLRMLQQIQTTLNEIVRLQEETNAKLDALDAKITSQHQAVMRLLLRIDSKVSFLVDRELAKDDTELQSCDEFEKRVKNRAAFAVAKNQAVYDAYVQVHNSSDDYQDNFLDCKKRLLVLARLSNERPHYSLLNRDAAEKDRFLPANTRSSTHQHLYAPAWKLTRDLLSIGNQRACQARLMSRLTAMPLSSAETAEFACPEADSDGSKSWLTPSGSTVSVSSALYDYLAHDAQWSGDGTTIFQALLRYQTAQAPFYEMTSSTNARKFKQLKDMGEPWVNQPDAADRWLNFLDVAAVAASQESIMAGIPITTQVMAKLQDLKTKPGFGITDFPATDDFKERCDDTGIAQADTKADNDRAAISNARFVCVLERNPFMVANAVTTWMVKNVTADMISTYNYTSRGTVLPIMQEQIPALGVQADADGVYGFVVVRNDSYNPYASAGGMRRTEGWYYKWRGVAYPMYTPLPSAFELDRKMMRYRPQAETLRGIIAQAIAQHQRYAIRADSGASARLVPNIAAAEAMMVNGLSANSD
jgi:hypothetical protein